MAKETVVQKISPRIEWLRERADEIIKSVEELPYDQIEDRIVVLNGAHGPSEKVVAKKEDIEKARRASLMEYAQLIEMIEKMEASEAAKVQARGNTKLSSRAAKFMSNEG